MKNKGKIYIAGSGGMLGDAFFQEFSQDFELSCSDIDVNSEWLHYLDFRNYQEYRDDVVKFQPNYLFHLGAYTDLEYCEQYVDDTYETNTLAVENAVKIANELNIPLLYISTAGIFDGKKEVYDDWDLPNPICHYARSKYAGELYVIQNSSKFLVCRAGWMMGGGPTKDKKFVNKIMKQIASGKKELFVVNDKLGTPTYTVDFAKNVRLLLEKEFWGVYNLVCSGITGRFEVAQEIVKCLKREDEIIVTEVSSAHFAKEYFAARPASERLLTKKLDLRGLNRMSDWRSALEDYVNKHYIHLKK